MGGLGEGYLKTVWMSLKAIDKVSKCGIIALRGYAMKTRSRLVNTTFRLTREQLRRAKEQAKREGMTLSQKLRWLVMMWLAKTETEGQEAGDETGSR